MGNVTAVMMDVITEKSGHSMTGLAVSVCLTPAAPSPLPIPYPTMATVSEGVIDECLRTKIDGAKVLTVGSCTKNCHGNEPGTLKEVVSLNTAGPCFPIMGAPVVFIELGMAGITGSPGFMNKNPVPGIGGSASGAGGGGSGAGSGGGGGGGPGGSNSQGPSNGGGGGGGSNSAAAPPSPPAAPGADGQATAGHPVDVITGTLFTSPQVDFALPGFLWVQFKRTYLSSAAEQNIGLGYGWTHSLYFKAIRHGDMFTITDDALRSFDVPVPADDEIAVLSYGRKLYKGHGGWVVDLGDDLLRVLRAADQSPSTLYLAELRDAHGNFVEIDWEDGQIARIVDSVGRVAEAEKDGHATTWRVTVQDEEGRFHEKMLVRYELDERGDLASVLDAAGVATRYAYDEAHFMIEECQPDGVVYHFRYENIRGQKLCVETWGDLPGKDIFTEIGAQLGSERPRGIHHARLDYLAPYETKVIDAMGQVHHYVGNALGLVLVYTDPRGYKKRYAYDETGRLRSVTDGGGRIMERRYDLLGRLVSTREPGGATTMFKHDDETGLLTVSVGPLKASERKKSGSVIERVGMHGRKAIAAYDEHGKNTSIEWSSGHKEAMTYDAHGNVIRHETATGAAWEYTFDLYGQPVRMKTPQGAEYKISYDSRGDVVLLEGPRGQRVEILTNAMRRVVRERHAGGGERTNRFVAGAIVEQIHADGMRFRMGYDPLLRLSWIENAAGERFTVEYDSVGNPVRQRTFGGALACFEYDGSNKLVSVLRPDESRMAEQRNADGLMISREVGGFVTKYEYDDIGRLRRAANGIASVEYFFNEGGRIEREVQSAGGWRFAVSYAYNLAGEITERKYSSGWSVKHERRPEDAMLLATRIDSPLGKEAILFERNPAGTETKRQREDGSFVATRAHDALGFVTEIAILNQEGESVRKRSYTWSSVGPLTEVTDSMRGSRTYTLDPVGRPLTANGLGASERFAYSPHGTAMSADRPWNLGPNGRPTQTGTAACEWDRMGRLAAKHGAKPQESWTYTYDADARLVRATRGDGFTVDYLYDPFGRMLAETAGGSATWFGWDADQIVEERRTDGRSRLTVFDDDGHTPICEAEDGVGWQTVLTDAAGTPWLYTDQKGQHAEIDLTAWGQVSRSEGRPGPLRFAGQRMQTMTGLHYNRHRFYAPDLHVYLTPDPLGMLGSIQEIGFLANSTLWIDPSGLLTIITASNEADLNNAYYGRYPARYPGARILTPAQVTAGALAGPPPETQVMIDTHGSPGSIEWAGQNISGQELGRRLNAAGFNGTAPGARVDVVACNSATGGFFTPSVAQGVANETGATASGGRALGNSALLGHIGLSGLVSGMPSGNPPSGLRVNGFGSWQTGITPQRP